SGGSLVDGNFGHWWSGLLFWLGLPIAIVATTAYLTARTADLSASTLGMLLIPFGVVLGLATRFMSLSFLTDLPRTFLLLVTVFAVIMPDRLRRWFGVE